MRDDFMFFETFKEDIDNFREIFGEAEAEKLALDILHYGVTGKRKMKKEEVHPVHNSLMVHIQIHIDKSKERFERAVKENEANKRKNWNTRNKKSMVSALD